jgi:sugar lactone lactonase YvrE
MQSGTVLEVENIVGESLVWDERRERLLWVDIVPGVIHELTPATGAHRTWTAPEIATSIGLREDGGAIVGLKKRVALWDFGERFETLAEIEPERGDTRLNEGVVGPDGAFWVGTMQNNIADDGSPREINETCGRLWRVTPGGEVRPLCDDRFGVTNTLVWPAPGRLVTADTAANALYSYHWDAGTGRLSGRALLLAGFPRGLPDGSALDAEGFVWNCRVIGGACVIRVAPDGTVERVLELPCSWPTSCAFGGPRLDRLYVTSARFTMSAQHLAAAPLEGALFAADVGVPGWPAYRFG